MEGGDTRPATDPGQARQQSSVIAAALTPPQRRWKLHRRAVRHVGRGAHHVLRWFASFAAVLILVASLASGE